MPDDMKHDVSVYYSKDAQRDAKDPVGFKTEYFRRKIFSDCEHVGYDYKNVATHHKLCTELIDYLPDLSNKKVLILFNPELLLLIANRYPAANITMFTGSQLASSMKWSTSNIDIVLTEPYNINKFSNQVKDMKFDIVIGNPPYQLTNSSGKRADQAQNLWSLFTYKAFNELLEKDGIMALVTPASWLSPGADVRKPNINVNFFKDYFVPYNCLALNINECAKYFENVGSSFSYFVVQHKLCNNNTMVITNSGSFSVNLRDYSVIPKEVTMLSLSINKKVLNGKLPANEFTNNGPGEIKKVTFEKTETLTHKVLAYHTPAKGGSYWYANKPLETHYMPKILISISGNYAPVYDPGELSYTRMICRYILKESETLENAKTVLDSKLYRYMVAVNKLTGWLPTPVFRSLPKFSYTRPWTDEEIFAKVKLNKREIAYIDQYLGE